MGKSVNSREKCFILRMAVFLMLFLFLSASMTYADTHLKKPYALKGSSKKQIATLTWKCSAKNVHFKIYKKESGKFKYVKTVKKKHAKVRIRKTCSFAVRAVKGNKSSSLSDPVTVKCWRGTRIAKFLINEKGKVSLAKLNGHQDGTSRQIKTKVTVGKEIDVSKFGDNRTGRRIKVTGIYPGDDYSTLSPIYKSDNVYDSTLKNFVIEGTDVNSGGIYQCLIESMPEMGELLIDTVQYHMEEYPIAVKSCKDFDYIRVGSAINIADGTMALNSPTCRNFLIQIQDPDVILYCSGNRDAESFKVNAEGYINLFKTDDGVRTFRGHKYQGRIVWEKDNHYNDYNNEMGQWVQTNMSISVYSEYTDYWIRACKGEDIIYEWLDLAAFLDGNDWVTGY